VETALKSLWLAYPEAQSSPMIIDTDEVAQLIRDKMKTVADYAVIDVRKNDHGVNNFHWFVREQLNN
jgi:hypothetical protein